MSYDEVLRYERGDGQEAVTIEVDVEFARYVYWRWHKADQANPYEGEHWFPVRWSGLYATAADAHADALKTIDWLRK